MFKVGDRVRIIARKKGHRFSIGEIVEIVNHNKRDYPPYKAVGAHDYWWIDVDEMELAKETEMKNYKLIEEAQDTMPTTRVGGDDIVYFVDNAGQTYVLAGGTSPAFAFFKTGRYGKLYDDDSREECMKRALGDDRDVKVIRL